MLVPLRVCLVKDLGGANLWRPSQWTPSGLAAGALGFWGRSGGGGGALPGALACQTKEAKQVTWPNPNAPNRHTKVRVVAVVTSPASQLGRGGLTRQRRHHRKQCCRWPLLAAAAVARHLGRSQEPPPFPGQPVHGAKQHAGTTVVSSLSHWPWCPKTPAQAPHPRPTSLVALSRRIVILALSRPAKHSLSSPMPRRALVKLCSGTHWNAPCCCDCAGLGGSSTYLCCGPWLLCCASLLSFSGMCVLCYSPARICLARLDSSCRRCSFLFEKATRYKISKDKS